jgi:UMF1 family MFS transporter
MSPNEHSEEAKSSPDLSLENTDDFKAETSSGESGFLDIDAIQLETRTSKLNVFNWSMYDLANTIFSMIIVSYIIKKYCLIIGQEEHGLSYRQSQQIINVAFIVMGIIVAICMPIMGALSDNVGRRKKIVLGFTVVILITASFLGIEQNMLFVLIFFIISNIAYQFSLTFYDSMLPFIASPKDAGKVGGFGVAFGYMGTVISLPVALLLTMNLGSSVSDPEIGTLSYGFFDEWYTYVIFMGMFLVTAIPFIFVKEREKKAKTPPLKTLIKNSFRQVFDTFKDIKNHKEMFKFVIGYFLIVDVANIIVGYMLLIVTDGLLMAESFGLILIFISTISAVIFTYFIGMFANKYGAKKSFYLVGGLWAIAIILGIIGITVFADVTDPISIGFNFPFILVLMMGILSGPALGGTWVSQRQMVVQLAPKEKFGEYIGFTKLSGKINAIFGELIWLLVFFSRDGFLNLGVPHYTYALELGIMGLIMGIGLLIVAFVKPTNILISQMRDDDPQPE